MFNDRELLEQAAKAAGIFEQGEWFDNWTIDENGEDKVCCQSFVVGNTEWNPLTDDGDALRLAVKLGLSVFVPTEESWDVLVSNDELSITVDELGGDDPYAATRRAIVRAAAEIEKDKHGNA